MDVMGFLAPHSRLEATDTFNSCSKIALTSVVQLVGSHKVKGYQFYSHLEHTLGCGWSQVSPCERGNRSKFLSHIDVSLPLFLLPFPAL